MALVGQPHRQGPGRRASLDPSRSRHSSGSIFRWPRAQLRGWPTSRIELTEHEAGTTSAVSPPGIAPGGSSANVMCPIGWPQYSTNWNRSGRGQRVLS